MSHPLPHIHCRHTIEHQLQHHTAHKPTPKPFHESIVDIIGRCPAEGFATLAEVIKNTEIEENHINIVMAWGRRLRDLKIHKDYGVTASVENRRIRPRNLTA